MSVCIHIWLQKIPIFSECSTSEKALGEGSQAQAFDAPAKVALWHLCSAQGQSAARSDGNNELKA